MANDLIELNMTKEQIAESAVQKFGAFVTNFGRTAV